MRGGQLCTQDIGLRSDRSISFNYRYFRHDPLRDLINIHPWTYIASLFITNGFDSCMLSG